mmetsp:Transcript_20895/g.25662  ORF Transcript_20895/g.25662 Transcript_20895/m.25662 type:complete len:136 (+) Transcript_20895:1414-1821(+)
MIENCELEGLVVFCKDHDALLSKPTLLSVYNPSVEVENFIFLRIPSSRRIEVSRRDKYGRLNNIPSETFCSKKVEVAKNDATCDVLINVEIEGLSFAHIVVTPLTTSEVRPVATETAYKAFGKVKMENDVTVSAG